MRWANSSIVLGSPRKTAGVQVLTSQRNLGGVPVRNLGADQTVVFLKVQGVVSAEAFAHSVDRCRDDVPLGALVACLLNADIRAGVDELCRASLQASRAANGVGGGGGGGRRIFSLPGALVVPAGAVLYWRAYCAAMAGAGILRCAFADAHAATRWATVQAAVARAEAAFRCRPTQATE